MKTVLPIASGIHLGGHGPFHGYGAPGTLSLPSDAARLYKGGPKGNEVKRLQEILNFLGYKDNNGKVLETKTGIFGNNTKAAVIKFNTDVRNRVVPIPGEWEVEGWGTPEWMDMQFPAGKDYIDGWGVQVLNTALKAKGGGSIVDNATSAVNEILGLGGRDWGDDSDPAASAPSTTTSGSTTSTNGTSVTKKPLLSPAVKYSLLAVGAIGVLFLVYRLGKK